MTSIYPKIPVGTDNFKKMITEYDVFVDKSLFIKEIIDSGEEAILLTKARRWGKTLNMDMLKTFLSIDSDQNGNLEQKNSNRILFTGGKLEDKEGKKLEKLKIAEIDNGKYITNHQGKYPVIAISFKDIVANSYQEIEVKLKAQIKELFRVYEYLKHSNKLSSYQKEDLERYLKGDISKDEISSGLKFLSQLLYKHHNKKVYILVDEYDKPVNHLLEKDALNPDHDTIKQVSELITYMFSECGKTNDALEKIILTGIYDTLKKEGSSGFNNVKVHNFFDYKFSKSFGFNEDEVNYIIDKLSLEGETQSIKQNIKNWYNGYSIPSINGSTIQVYTPWAVVSYLDDVQSGNLQPKSYWSKSGASTILQSLIRSVAEDDLSNKFRALAEGKEQIFKYEELTSLLEHNLGHSRNIERIFSYLLLNSGYLTAKRNGDYYYFKVPNLEVKKEFASVIENEIERIGFTNQSEIRSFNHDYKQLLLKSLDMFENNKFKQAIEIIKVEDQKGLEKFFTSNPSFKCYDKNSNFNLLQIAAIKGNSEIFSILLSLCDNKLLSSKINGLKALDYAYISGSQDIKLTDTELLISAPSMTDKLICYPLGGIYLIYNLIAVSAITGGVKLANKMLTPKDLSTIKLLGVLASTDIILNLIKEATKSFGNNKFGLCDNYDNYQKINTDLAKPYKSVAQLEKYVLEHSNTYVTLDSNCKDGYYKVTEAEIPIFKYDDANILLFGLCQQYLDSNEL